MNTHGEQMPDTSRLYVVATPIGNLADITLRALQVLGSVDIVFAEDTRTTGQLLAHHGIRTKLASLHEHNEAQAAESIVAHLDAGRSVALASDAGTPGISDPGAIAVAHARAKGHEVVPIPGASALVAAMSVAGMPGPFAFVGFLPASPAARRKALDRWRTVGHTLVFFEAPHRIVECVEDLCLTLGSERNVVLARELTKMFESVHACTLGAARSWLAEDPNRLRGEFVVVVAGAAENEQAKTEEAERILRLLLAELPLAQAVKLAAEITGARRNVLYERALQIADNRAP
jgi:16S rRNA (cytidine1402-2'-O)-methyltransferase